MGQGTGSTRWRQRALLGLTAALVWLAVAWTECFVRVRYTHEASATARADVAIVLGAAVWGHARPSPALERRLRAGLALYTQGRVRYLATTGGVGRGHQTQPLAEGLVAARWLVRHGVPERAVLREERSHNTVENLRWIRPILRARGLSSALIVSDGYHLARALTIARDTGLVAEGVACDGSIASSLAREPARHLSEARWLLLYAVTRPTARW
ncbi:MAG: YdcF family protein [Deltaproteobacteria bacterium]|nr:YdcF family protein [Deltaproteobacteria bacterium]